MASTCPPMTTLPRTAGEVVLGHVHDVDGQRPAAAEAQADRQQDQRWVVRHVTERPDERSGQHRGQDQRRAPADLVGQPAHAIAADQDADTGFQGVEDQYCDEGDEVLWLPKERIRVRASAPSGWRALHPGRLDEEG